MKISYTWLKDFMDLPESPEAVAELLTSVGIESSVIPNPASGWCNIVTARVESAERHPNADKLRLCSVTDSERTYSLVCGAPNVAAGQTIALARIDAVLPGGLRIKRAKIRGVESEGMICSEAELGLAPESEGIMELPGDTPLGVPLAEALGGVDTVIEVETATNRPDLLSHAGIARELSARLGRPLNMPAAEPVKAEGAVSIDIEADDLCGRYIGCAVSGVSVGPSPRWLAERLERCGLRPINNIVDVTNYVLLELGHPLHAFDKARVAGDRIVVRTALPGERITALDGREHSLNDNNLVIADTEKALAIAGVIGGEQSGVSDATTDIILESALFAPGNVRRTARSLSISTDASYRFERGTSWEMAELASRRALTLIREIAGGTVTARTDARSADYEPVAIGLRPQRARRVLNMDIAVSEMVSILSGLGMAVKENEEVIEVIVPSWRLDVHQEIDLIEEIVRIKGYDAVGTTVLPVIPDAGEVTSRAERERRLRRRIASLGFSEVVNYSLLSETSLRRFGLPVTARVDNPLSRENEVLRTSLLPGLWANHELNTAQGMPSVRIFETGTVFTGEGERKHLGILVSGPLWPEWWGWEMKKVSIPDADFYYLSAVVRSVLPDIRLKTEGAAPYFHPGKAAVILYRGTPAGQFGILRPDLSEGESEAGYAEIDLSLIGDTLLEKSCSYKPVRRRPPVKRDFSFVIDSSIPYDQVAAVLNRMKQTTSLEDFRLFSVYDDPERIGVDRKSYSFHLLFRHPERTLTDKDVAEQFDAIVKALTSKLRIVLR